MWIRHESQPKSSSETIVSVEGKQPSDLLAALYRDPTVDHQYPAKTLPQAVPSHGVALNSVLYTAAGADPHPTVLLLHGLPGNEQNLDFAQAARRSGWNVLMIHYRGSWGGRGNFTLANCLEDAAASLEWLMNSTTAQKHRIDPTCIAIIGHSMGGFIAAHTAAAYSAVVGLAVISAADLGLAFGGGGSQATSAVDDNIGFSAGLHILAHATPSTLAEEAHQYADCWNITKYAAVLKDRPSLVITSEDNFASHGDNLYSTIQGLGGTKVTRAHFASDHAYSDCRIALQVALLKWLGTLVNHGHS